MTHKSHFPTVGIQNVFFFLCTIQMTEVVEVDVMASQHEGQYFRTSYQNCMLSGQEKERRGMTRLYSLLGALEKERPEDIRATDVSY